MYYEYIRENISFSTPVYIQSMPFQNDYPHIIWFVMNFCEYSTNSKNNKMHSRLFLSNAIDNKTNLSYIIDIYAKAFYFGPQMKWNFITSTLTKINILIQLWNKITLKHFTYIRVHMYIYLLFYIKLK